MKDSGNMHALSNSIGQKRPLSPDTQFGRCSEGKRRATTNIRPVLQVDTMMPPRPTPQLLLSPKFSPFHSKPSGTYEDFVDFTSSLNQAHQNMMPQATMNWTQFTGATHATLSENNVNYHSENGFIEACKTSVESCSSYSFSSLSQLSSASNPFRDLCSAWTPSSLAALPAQAEMNISDSVNAIIVRLQRLQSILVEQSGILEEVVKTLQAK
jgi:hypothetical protein